MPISKEKRLLQKAIFGVAPFGRGRFERPPGAAKPNSRNALAANAAGWMAKLRHDDASSRTHGSAPVPVSAKQAGLSIPKLALVGENQEKMGNAYWREGMFG